MPPPQWSRWFFRKTQEDSASSPMNKRAFFLQQIGRARLSASRDEAWGHVGVPAEGATGPGAEQQGRGGPRAPSPRAGRVLPTRAPPPGLCVYRQVCCRSGREPQDQPGVHPSSWSSHLPVRWGSSSTPHRRSRRWMSGWVWKPSHLRLPTPTQQPRGPPMWRVQLGPACLLGVEIT